MLFGRMSGILLHPTSLPGPFGIGDLGPEAYRFVDFLADSGQQLWQVLPLGPTGWGNSPYMCFSAFAGNPLLISPDLLVREGWLDPDSWTALPEWPHIQASFAGRVSYDWVIPFKFSLLHQAWQTFRERATAEQKAEFTHFCQEESYWLDDYALFITLKDEHRGGEWMDWEPPLAQRDPEALKQAEQDYADLIAERKFLQFAFAKQWRALKAYANGFGISVMGDQPIYVAQNSADVWANRHLFYLDPETGRPKLVSGVPPDFFSETGQRWGNPLYNWETLKARRYDWWVSRMRAIFKTVDCVRIDHFRGFESFWAIPGEAPTAIDGNWQKGPGTDFFNVLQEELGEIPVVAEDLGDITPEVLELRDQFNLPGMKILLFAFGGGPGNPYLPHCFTQNCVVYTGTHDNNTAVGWFYEQISEAERQAVIHYLGALCPEGIHWDLIRVAMMSVSDLAIIPLQDVMGLGADSRMNFPGTSENNWAWRFTGEMLHEWLVNKLADTTVTYGRIPEDKLYSNRDRLRQRGGLEHP